eukprot:scaffold878_cov271-Pinguiococcus_pyrenoidosus.AAC.19
MCIYFLFSSPVLWRKNASLQSPPNTKTLCHLSTLSSSFQASDHHLKCWSRLLFRPKTLREILGLHLGESFRSAVRKLIERHVLASDGHCRGGHGHAERVAKGEKRGHIGPRGASTPSPARWRPELRAL